MPDTDPIPAICQRLTALRLRHFGPRGRRRFAQLLKTPHTTYCAYETGRIPPADLLATVAELTGCDAAWLLTGQPEPTAPQQVTLPGLTAAQNDIVRRLAQHLAGHPAALPAVQAFAELLMQTRSLQKPATGEENPASPAQPTPTTSQPTSRLIPVIGRAAAGHVLKWPAGDARDAMNSLHSVADALKSAAATLPVDTIDGSDSCSASAAIIQLPDPHLVNAVSIDTVLAVTSSDTGRSPVAVSIDGDSMADRLHHGDIVIADTENTPSPGDIAIVMLAGQAGATCKLYWQDGNSIRLIPANPAYPPMQTTTDEVVFAWKVLAVVRCAR